MEQQVPHASGDLTVPGPRVEAKLAVIVDDGVLDLPPAGVQAFDDDPHPRESLHDRGVPGRYAGSPRGTRGLRPRPAADDQEQRKDMGGRDAVGIT